MKDARASPIPFGPPGPFLDAPRSALLASRVSCLGPCTCRGARFYSRSCPSHSLGARRDALLGPRSRLSFRRLAPTARGCSPERRRSRSFRPATASLPALLCGTPFRYGHRPLSPAGTSSTLGCQEEFGPPDFGSDVPELERIGRRADRENDARTLAFVGLALPILTCCPDRDHHEANYYAERAVTIDPSLAWVYRSRVRGFGSRADESEWLAQLKAFDPENALPYLLSADEILEERRFALIQQHTPTDLEVQASVENDAQWLGDVQRAIRAPRFDTYSKNYLDLFKAFYRQNPSLEPFMYLLASHRRRIARGSSLEVYVSILIRRAEEARSVESFTTATGELKRIVQFEQASRQSEDDWISQFDQPAMHALQGLKATLVKRGLTEDAMAVEDSLQRFEKRPRNRPILMCWTQSGFGPLWWTAVMVHSLGFALALFSCLFFASIVILEIPGLGQWRLRRFVRERACLLADLCPGLLVLTCVAFVFAYQPFVRTFNAQVSQSASLFDLETIRATNRTLDFLPSILFPYVGWVFVPWALACFLLALLALFILLRGFFRTRPKRRTNWDTTRL